MKCPHCGFGDSRVVNSRPAQNDKAIRRRRECLQCGKRFTTYETVVEILPHITKKDGRREDYDRSKLERGIRKALEKRPISESEVEGLIDAIESELYRCEAGEVASSAIGERVMEKLRKLDIVAYVRFASVYREFKDPNDFIKELKEYLENKG
ncbi:MAG TPA: transcriptional repressor NrdR [Firmicutes bacterium]|nr:transcriptional repressor NrdR [Bacillota bacterium]